jgi:glycosyltransferase involved in cell wall biosynthesis
MRFAINAVAMHKQGGGSRHLEGLVAALGLVCPKDKFFLCLDRRFQFSNPSANVTVRPVSVDAAWQRLYWDQFGLPTWGVRSGICAIVELFNLGMYTQFVPQVSLQRNALYYCQAHFAQLTPNERRALSARRWMAYLTMRASRLIIVPSLAMRDMIYAFHPDLPRERFRVLPHGYARTQLGRQPLPPTVARDFASVQDRPVILYISHLWPHKVHDVAVRMLAELKRRGSNACLVLTMDRSDWAVGFDRLTNQIAAQGLTNDVVNLGRVPEAALDALYRRADLFYFPSLCESFGFPMVEALGYELPIVAADTAINRELCAGAVMYYDPADPVAAAECILDLLSSPTQRQRLTAESNSQFKMSHIGWEEYALKLCQLLHEAVEVSP